MGGREGGGGEIGVGRGEDSNRRLPFISFRCVIVWAPAPALLQLRVIRIVRFSVVSCLFCLLRFRISAFVVINFTIKANDKEIRLQALMHAHARAYTTHPFILSLT